MSGDQPSVSTSTQSPRLPLTSAPVLGHSGRCPGRSPRTDRTRGWERRGQALWSLGHPNVGAALRTRGGQWRRRWRRCHVPDAGVLLPGGSTRAAWRWGGRALDRYRALGTHPLATTLALHLGFTSACFVLSTASPSTPKVFVPAASERPRSISKCSQGQHGCGTPGWRGHTSWRDGETGGHVDMQTGTWHPW